MAEQLKVSGYLKIGPVGHKAKAIFLSVFQVDAEMVKVSHCHHCTVGVNVPQAPRMDNFFDSYYWGHCPSLHAGEAGGQQLI